LSGRAFKVQLLLTGLLGIGEKRDAAAVWCPGDVGFGAARCGRGSDFADGRFAIGGRDEDGVVAGVDAVVVAEGFDPGDFFAVGRESDFEEVVRGS